MTAQFSRSAAQFARRTIIGRAHERHDLCADRHDGSDVRRRRQRLGQRLKTIIEGSLAVAHRSSGKFARKQRVDLGQFRVGALPQSLARLDHDPLRAGKHPGGPPYVGGLLHSKGERAFFVTIATSCCAIQTK
jgi:hypothetical protein